MDHLFLTTCTKQTFYDYTYSTVKNTFHNSIQNNYTFI